jgi:hypothetical protein
MQPKWGKRSRPEGGSETTGLRLWLLRKDLNKWVDFDSFKYTVDGIGVFAGEPLCVFQRVRFDDDKTPRLIRKRTG